MGTPKTPFPVFRTCLSMRWVYRHPREACCLVWHQPGMVARFLFRHPRFFITGRNRTIRAKEPLAPALSLRAEQLQARLLAAVSAHDQDRA